MARRRLFSRELRALEMEDDPVKDEKYELISRVCDGYRAVVQHAMVRRGTAWGWMRSCRSAEAARLAVGGRWRSVGLVFDRYVTIKAD